MKKSPKIAENFQSFSAAPDAVALELGISRLLHSPAITTQRRSLQA
jgi:hypothetical protein